MMFAHSGPINNIPVLVQILAWRRPGDKPLSEPMTNSSLTHIGVTRPQRVNAQSLHRRKMDVEHEPCKIYYRNTWYINFRNEAENKSIQKPPDGTAACLSSHLMYQPLVIANMSDAEILVCTMKRENDSSIKVMAVYKPPAVPLQCLLNSLYSAVKKNWDGGSQLIIMGYFNIDTYGSRSDYEQMEQFMWPWSYTAYQWNDNTHVNSNWPYS